MPKYIWPEDFHNMDCETLKLSCIIFLETTHFSKDETCKSKPTNLSVVRY